MDGSDKGTHDGAMLVVVHPGSACGSADFHHGRRLARAMRERLSQTLHGWRGAVTVIDSDLSGELAGEPDLAGAIDACLGRSHADGSAARRLSVAGERWIEAGRALIQEAGPGRVVLTGAWYHPDDDGGCVNAMRDALVQSGIAVDIHGSAMSIDLD